MAAQLMLGRKGIPYQRVDLINVVSRAWLRAAGFPGIRVPAMKLDGEKIQGSREISRALDRIQPEPPLFPTDSAERAKVEEAERWGDEELQAPVRRILWNGIKRDRSSVRSYLEGYRLGIPTGVAVATAAPLVAISSWLNEASDENVRGDLEALPTMLDRIDGWIADGTIGGEAPNAADFQIACSIRLLLTVEDLRPAIESRPAGELAMRLVPEFPGRLPPVFPEEWLAALRTGAVA
jgi:glutathione S-transferase